MKAGRELDALVAEKVMGMRPGTEDCWVDPASSYGGQLPLAHYSTDIAAAWAVVENIKSLHPDDREELTFAMNYYPEDKIWRFGWESYGEFGQFSGDAETAPHAICLAALAAVGHRINHEDMGDRGGQDLGRGSETRG